MHGLQAMMCVESVELLMMDALQSPSSLEMTVQLCGAAATMRSIFSVSTDG